MSDSDAIITHKKSINSFDNKRYVISISTYKKRQSFFALPFYYCV